MQDFDATVLFGRTATAALDNPFAPTVLETVPGSELDLDATLAVGRGVGRTLPQRPEAVPFAPPSSPEAGGFDETIILPAALWKGKGAGQR